jgi:hypothetical protein
MFVHFTLKSDNVKTGPIPVSTISADTCSDNCPFKGNGCYAGNGPLSWHWNKVTAGIRGSTWEEYCDRVSTLEDNQLWRHAQAGDLPGVNHRIDFPRLQKLVRANKRKKGFTYTHKPVLNNPRNQASVAWANQHGFTVNLSADSLSDADALADLEIAPVVTVLPEHAPEKLSTPAGRTVIVCPAQSREDVTCATCGLCQRQDRTVIVGFRAHGTAKRKVENVFFKGEAA